jgi:hypothetical protein
MKSCNPIRACTWLKLRIPHILAVIDERATPDANVSPIVLSVRDDVRMNIESKVTAVTVWWPWRRAEWRRFR